jgi:hypothetical protein
LTAPGSFKGLSIVQLKEGKGFRMALYVVIHRHGADNCPARDPRMGSMLLDHLSASSAARHQVKIQSDAVIKGGHTFYLIVEAADQASINRLMEPFAAVGSVEIFPASTCEEVVERGAC